jgi:DNA-binding CsgD family transcriptional regulator
MALRPEVGDLVAQIYEAALIAEQWPGVMDLLAESCGAQGGVLIGIDGAGANLRWVSSPAIQQHVVDFFAHGWMERNARAMRLAAMNHPGFLSDLEAMSAEEMDEAPIYRDFLRPRGYGWAAGAIVPTASEDTLIFSFERRLALGPVSREGIAFLDLLRPHLARAALVSVRMRLEQLRTATQILETVGLAAAAVDGSGRLLPTGNGLFNELIPATLQDRRARLVLTDPDADCLFLSAIESLSRRDVPGVSSIALRCRSTRRRQVLHVIPIAGAARDVFAGAMAMLMLTPVGRPLPPTPDLLAGLFDLTAAEARVAARIAAGSTIDEISADTGRSRETIRIQLRSAMAKTGTRRQAELTALVTGAGAVRPGSPPDDDNPSG